MKAHYYTECNKFIVLCLLSGKEWVKLCEHEARQLVNYLNEA